ncbi:ABC transporter ATP-binding protein [Edaphobacillus lindanitolerans]|uniref:Peptide/nickel transport system ATP-binding protein/oligopeptide transport system ATP-binding protein n=1 Tax=Edaphobacillus lindanitolerans TaxID=550447 RepID=A0A1U7PIC6_9BACI|nr:dipeptide ABC transporter ATP-binding protein [Edaphobacillus lindanitolerans]SIT73023.1 peptide/nickel transport system ATP-binding protein/oligopeptide transport system ATP-binding protein [Edaphobacillus lindanitolerans]
MPEPILEIRNLEMFFPVKGKVFQKEKDFVKAVNGVNLKVNKGETLGIVGESGCGKSTLARTLVGLLEPTAGDILFEGKSILGSGRKQMHQLRKDIQMVYQDPYTSLNPRMKAGEIIAAPLKAYRMTDNLERRVKELMDRVGLKAEDYAKFPHQFSGGQRQRIGIARALALNPKLIILDEPVSALDVSIQAQVINLLEDLQKELGLTYVFIAHDLSVIKHIADQVAVMYLGKIMEVSDSESFYQDARHPYTNALLSAIPFPDPEKEKKRRRLVLGGELPSPADPPSGCVFHTRCPLAQDRCKMEIPCLEPKDENTEHLVSCFYPIHHGTPVPSENN